MKVRELIEQLKDCLDAEISFSVDVSTGEDDHGRRAFGDSIHEIIKIVSGPVGAARVDEVTLCIEGELNE